MLELGRSGLPRSKTYYVNEPSYDTDAAWLKKILLNSSGDIYFSSGEVEYQVYSKLAEEFHGAWVNGVDVHFMAGPIINVPENYGTEKKQKGREELNPITNLAKWGKIKLYPSEMRQLPDYRIFEDIPVMNVLEPHAPGDKPSGSLYVYTSWIDAAPWIRRFNESTEYKKPVSKNFHEHFLFLTDKEVGELRNWASKKRIDVNKIDLETCREFWTDYTK